MKGYSLNLSSLVGDTYTRKRARALDMLDVLKRVIYTKVKMNKHTKKNKRQQTLSKGDRENTTITQGIFDEI